MKFRFVFLLVIVGIFLQAFDNSQDSSAKKIQELARHEITSICKECKIAITPKWIPNVIERLESHQITDIQFTEVGLPKGYQTASVIFQENDKRVSQDVQLHIRIEKLLPVAAKRIKRNEVISDGDLLMQMTDITRLQRMPIDSKEEIVNQSANSLIKKGSVIYRLSLQKKPVIHAGDRVKMIYAEGGVEVALNCNAREDKAAGEIIRLYSEKTRKTYIGKVVDAEKVLWEKTL